MIKAAKSGIFPPVLITTSRITTIHEEDDDPDLLAVQEFCEDDKFLTLADLMCQKGDAMKFWLSHAQHDLTLEKIDSLQIESHQLLDQYPKCIEADGVIGEEYADLKDEEDLSLEKINERLLS